MKKFLIFILLFSAPLLAAEDYYTFTSKQQQQQFQVLTSELRCLVCQNQNLAESNSGLAADLRDQIYQRVQRGQSNQEIIDYLVARYGNFILYRPPVNGVTLILWLSPVLILVFGLIYLIYYLKSRMRK